MTAPCAACRLPGTRAGCSLSYRKDFSPGAVSSLWWLLTAWPGPAGCARGWDSARHGGGAPACALALRAHPPGQRRPLIPRAQDCVCSHPHSWLLPPPSEYLSVLCLSVSLKALFWNRLAVFPVFRLFLYKSVKHCLSEYLLLMYVSIFCCSFSTFRWTLFKNLKK